jgi:hypothetical protein
MWSHLYLDSYQWGFIGGRGVSRFRVGIREFRFISGGLDISFYCLVFVSGGLELWGERFWVRVFTYSILTI